MMADEFQLFSGCHILGILDQRCLRRFCLFQVVTFSTFLTEILSKNLGCSRLPHFWHFLAGSFEMIMLVPGCHVFVVFDQRHLSWICLSQVIIFLTLLTRMWYNAGPWLMHNHDNLLKWTINPINQHQWQTQPTLWSIKLFQLRESKLNC